MTNEERCDIALQAKEPERTSATLSSTSPGKGGARPNCPAFWKRSSPNCSTEGGRGSGRRGSQRHGRADGMVSPRRPPAVRRRLPRPPPGSAPETRITARPSSARASSRRRWSFGAHRPSSADIFPLIWTA